MTVFAYWPNILRPGQVSPNIVAFTRTGGKSLGGIERPIRSDRGYWSIALQQIALYDGETRRAWNALRSSLNGRAGLVSIPVWSDDSAAFPDGASASPDLPHSDGTFFSDGTGYLGTPAIEIRMNTLASIGATVVALRVVRAGPDIAGTRFSYNSALYEIGQPISISGAVWQVPVFPSLRAAIPADALLECDRPRCLVRLASDREMDVAVSRAGADKRDINFVEAVDYWTDLALEA